MLKKDEDDQIRSGPNQPEDPAILLSRALVELVEHSNDRRSKDIAEHTMPMLCQMGQIETKQQQTIYAIDSIKKQLEILTSNSKLSENANRVNQSLSKQHYEEHIIQPMVRSVFPVFDVIYDAKNFWRNNNQFTEKRTKDLIDAVLTQLKQFLQIYDIQIIEHKSGATFDPQIMKPVRTVTTDHKELSGRMAESLQIGFRLGQQRLLRLETVSLYKYQPGQTETSILIERSEDVNTRN